MALNTSKNMAGLNPWISTGVNLKRNVMWIDVDVIVMAWETEGHILAQIQT